METGTAWWGRGGDGDCGHGDGVGMGKAVWGWGGDGDEFFYRVILYQVTQFVIFIHHPLYVAYSLAPKKYHLLHLFYTQAER